ncbi:UDP-N-acetylmuramoyl-L-alanyl-D-glutamate--2,6-diaminopimelate ligase [Vibrio sp. JC009]|uniref:UDP-N-acetylmuramoyl-L-alanyl-D-glutamate--2, 6-diaminopimelate ligase n=1 Tax=Vibrio sp. JC009 TaxID=2912314 RepID=UPI0023AFBF32|nr:UDP-N-acetylmuramoyl-L-alanyl-D-glutamate--2,6-diaminopimelate ligase [Vibrio sp. JC009]WED21435.1 UDP-N-acetylmuramoyl-L-alanyl-D-glutamate--2,6-diaminopimelate ligase [Vibrio sp. JC009]
MISPFTLESLLSPWLASADSRFSQIEVTDLELDSRRVKPGTTFVAVIGHAVDGRKFIAKALENGANAVIAQSCEEKPHGLTEYVSEIPVVYIEALNLKLSELAGQLYTDKPELIGVTGTNGKTTITQLIAQWMTLVGKRASVMGTTGNGFLEKLKPAQNTTGSAIDIQRTLNELSQEGAELTALEVSSHGLVQGRVKALQFEAGVFTNLSRDHLDYHGSMENYASAKLELFTQHQCKYAIINADDSVGREWIKQLPQAVGVSLEKAPECEKGLWATDVHYSEKGISIRFDGHWGAGTLNAPLVGAFNASNVMLAFAALLSLGFSVSELTESSEKLQPVIGRMELFSAEQKAKIVVDYAHTPDALEKALSALRVHCSGKLWAIFGCGGDRDAGKRPMMASIAEKLADEVILTDDNPRSEDPAIIVNDMLAGMQNPKAATVAHNRFDALTFAAEKAQSQDIILLAGKGHEDYQVLKGETIHYSDRESAMKVLGITE